MILLLYDTYNKEGTLHLYWIVGGKWGIHSANPTSAGHGKPLFTPGKQVQP